MTDVMTSKFETFQVRSSELQFKALEIGALGKTLEQKDLNTWRGDVAQPTPDVVFCKFPH